MKRCYTVETKHTVTYEWKINSISLYLQPKSNDEGENIKFKSSSFSTSAGVRDLWKLHLNFNHNVQSVNKGFVSMYLKSLINDCKI